MSKMRYDSTGLRDSDGGTLLNATVIRSTVKQTNITIGITAVAIPTTPLSKRLSLVIFNNSTSGQILYLGDATVTSANGFPIYPRGSMNIQIEDEAIIYGIASAVDADVRLLEGS